MLRCSCGSSGPSRCSPAPCSWWSSCTCWTRTPCHYTSTSLQLGNGMSSREVSHLLQLLQGTPVLRIQFSATPSCHLWHFSVDGDNVCYKTWMQVWIYSTWILRYKIFITNTVSLGKMLHIELWIKDWDHDTSVKYSHKVSWSDTNLSQSYSRIYHIHTPLSEWKTSREMVHTGSDVL